VKEFLNLSMDYVAGMAHQPDKIKRFLQVRQLFELTWVPLEILAATYESLTRAGEFEKLENLDHEEKNRIWKIVTNWVVADKEYRIKCCKVLRLIEVLQNEKIQLVEI
jgi:hypothetical protein